MKNRGRKYASVLFRRLDNIPFDESAEKVLQTDLSDLAQLFATVDFPLFLVGGVGVSAQLDKFYRYHNDFDLAIFVDDLHKLEQYLYGTGYLIMRQFFITHMTKKYNFYILKTYYSSEIKEIPPGAAKIRIVQNKRFIYNNRQRTQIMDLFLMQKSDEGVIDGKNNNIIPYEDFYPAKKPFPGSNLMVPNINFRKHIPANFAWQRLDLKMAESGSIGQIDQQ